MATATTGFGDSIALAQFLSLYSTAVSESNALRFQNYYIGSAKNLTYTGASGSSVTNSFSFAPFSFSGVTITKSGDNQPATLYFPNNQVTRGWAESYIQAQYVARVITVLVDPDETAAPYEVNSYIGQIVGGKWDSTTLSVELASIFDAVGGDVPRKRLTRDLVGSLPLTNNVRVS